MTFTIDGIYVNLPTNGEYNFKLPELLYAREEMAKQFKKEGETTMTLAQAFTLISKG